MSLSKYIFRISILLFYNYSFGQQHQTKYSFPAEYNKFIELPTINWAAEIEDSVSFANSKPINSINIHSYLSQLVASGKLSAHLNKYDDFEGFENVNFSRYSDYSFITMPENELRFILADSLKKIQFHEILYLENYVLKCRIISSAPMVNYAAAGISLGLRQDFYCCGQTSGLSFSSMNSSVVYLKQTKKNYNLDSLLYFRTLKETFGFNLIEALWYGASQGKVKVINIETNKFIEAKDILSFTFDDSLKIPRYDSTGKLVGYNKQVGFPAFPRKFWNQIEITFEYYFDKKTNSFISVIKDCALFTKKWDPNNFKSLKNRAFKVTF